VVAICASLRCTPPAKTAITIEIPIPRNSECDIPLNVIIPLLASCYSSPCLTVLIDPQASRAHTKDQTEVNRKSETILSISIDGLPRLIPYQGGGLYG
jgi:hypothetical protein